jgi:hypothetical protein
MAAEVLGPGHQLLQCLRVVWRSPDCVADYVHRSTPVCARPFRRTRFRPAGNRLRHRPMDRCPSGHHRGIDNRLYFSGPNTAPQPARVGRRWGLTIVVQKSWLSPAPVEDPLPGAPHGAVLDLHCLHEQAFRDTEVSRHRVPSLLSRPPAAMGRLAPEATASERSRRSSASPPGVRLCLPIRRASNREETVIGK